MQEMFLDKFLEPLILKRVEGNPAGKVTGLVYHSHKVAPGNLFFSLNGRRGKGWQYAREALAKGALAAVVEDDCPLTDLPLIRVPDVRLTLALLANHFYGYPSHKLRLVGVTGTNGKTSTTHMIDFLFRRRGEVTGLLGTVGYRVGDNSLAPLATTPEASDLQEILARLATLGAEHVAMEVSSHALEQHRVTGCHFALAVLTNITGEHLDFHRTFDAYLQAKTKLFARLEASAGLQAAILNADDPCYESVKKWSGAQTVTYGITSKADVRAVGIFQEDKGVSFKVNSFAGRGEVRLPLKGRFNVYNALAAYTAGLVEGLEHEEISASLAAFPGVPGRFELVEAGQDYMVVVDYAHTPDGLENVIKTARSLTRGKVITVFGCGGERDRSKRPLMGEAAGRYSDTAILTDDNPRGEDPGGIMHEVVPGLRRYLAEENFQVINDRRKAIAAAIGTAAKGDLVLIAGKGHEEEQIYEDRSLPFSDRQVAKELILAKMKERGTVDADNRKRDS